MQPPLIPDNEPERQESLDRLGILDTPSEERFDRITRLAQRVLNVPIALVSLIDRDRQWFKSAQGLAATETPRDVSFCAHAILGDEPFIVTDASGDERFSDNPLVVEQPHIRFYAGQPIVAPDGHRVGTLCVIDREPRRLSGEDLGILRDLAALVESELRVSRLSEAQLELRARLASAELKAAIDPLTRLWNRDSIFEVARRELSRAERAQSPLALALADIDDFKAINDSLGHLTGDEVLRLTAEKMRGAVRPYDAVGRFGGEEFLILLSDTDRKTAESVSERVRHRIFESSVSGPGGDFSVTVSIGLACVGASRKIDLETLLGSADDALYRAKERGKNRIEATEL